MVQRVDPGTALPEGHPAAGRTDVAQPTAFICRGQVCAPPVTAPDALAEAALAPWEGPTA